MTIGDPRPHLHLLQGSERDYRHALDIIGGAQLVLLGEASHSTHDLYHRTTPSPRRPFFPGL